MEQEIFTKYERARILGARSLQIAMNAPLLIKISDDDLEKINFNALNIAEIEFNSNALPISIKKPFPKKKDTKLKRAKLDRISDEDKELSEKELEEEIKEGGEIMEIANPEDEKEDSESAQ